MLLDGAKVAMYAQWHSVEDYQAMRKNAAALPYMEQALTLAKFESGIYEVVETFELLPIHASPSDAANSRKFSEPTAGRRE